MSSLEAYWCSNIQDRFAGKGACALTARRSISKAVKGLVGGAAQGSADCRKNWTTASIPRTSGSGELAGARQRGAREQGRSKTAVASLPHVKLAPMSAPGLKGERQELLDAIISFAGAGQRRRLFRGLDILTISGQSSGILRCAQCGSDPEANIGSTDSGLMTRMGHKHEGSTSVTRKRGSAATARLGSLRILWHHTIAAGQSLQSLQEGHCDSGHHSG